MHVARQTYAARFSTGYESTNVRAMPDHRQLPFLRRQAEGGGKKVPEEASFKCFLAEMR
jgi:hypothetical protein